MSLRSLGCGLHHFRQLLYHKAVANIYSNTNHVQQYSIELVVLQFIGVAIQFDPPLVTDDQRREHQKGFELKLKSRV